MIPCWLIKITFMENNPCIYQRYIPIEDISQTCQKDTYGVGIGKNNNIREGPYPKPMMRIWVNHLQPN